MKKITFALTFSLLVSIFGCTTYSASKYAINTEIDSFNALRTLSGKEVNVGAFSATKPGEKKIMRRRVSPINTPYGEPFSEYIRSTLLDELKTVGVYAAQAPITLTRNLGYLSRLFRVPL